MPSIPNENKQPFILIGGIFFAALCAGLLSQPCLGDEITFYRLARGFFEYGQRWAIDPVYQKSGLIYYYNSEPLWPAVLGFLWKITGHVSLIAAQIYHTLYFAGLLLCTWLFSKKISGSVLQAFLSVLLLAATPMAVAFSILFYAEIPMMFFLILAAWLLLERKTFWAALALCAAYLTKATVLFFLPAFLWLVFQNEKNWSGRIRKIFLLMMPLLAVAAADSSWRHTHLNMAQLFVNEPAAAGQSSWQALIDRASLGDVRQRLKEFADSGLWEYTSSSLLNAVDVLKYFGILNIVLGIMFLVRKEWRVRPVESVFILCYFFSFLYMCIWSPDVRYLLPAVPFLASAAAFVLAGFWQKKMIRTVVLVFCFLQFAGSVAMVLKERQIPKEIQEGFSFIEKTVGSEELTIYPEYVFIEKTNRGVVWSHRFRDPLKQLFWSADKTKIVQYLLSHNIRYLMVKKARIYDDAGRRHFGGYPASFAGQLGNSSHFKLLFENKQLSIWLIQN